MIELSMTLVSTDATQRELVSCSIPLDEWEILLAFHQDVELLRSTSFVQNERGGQISISWKAGEPLSSRARRIEMEEVWSMMLKLRRFVLQREKHYFHIIKKMLKRRLSHTAFRKHIDLLEDVFTLQIMQKKVKVRGSGRPPLSVDVVMDWLNSFEYHQDESKRLAVQEDLGFLGKDQNGLPVVLFALVDMIQAILAMGDLVETLMELASGKRSEITCPPGYLSGV